MNIPISVVPLILLALLAATNAEKFNQYDYNAVKRFHNELDRLGVDFPSPPFLEEPTRRSAPYVDCPGGEIRGYWTKSQFGRPIAAFEGIPYGETLLSHNRFGVAQFHWPYVPHINATHPGPKCLQREDVFPTSRKIIGNEDCLYLNVYVPETVHRAKSERLPVMFFIHGGAFIVGHGDAYKSNVLLDKDVVLVTFNYRLGPLGFLSTEDDVMPGNLGLKDQVLALKWVHKNIAYFSGDPNRITVFGESAGGACAEFLMLSPLTKGLIHRVISMSGSSLAPWAMAPPGEMKRNREKVALQLGCPDYPSKEFRSCLQSKTAEEITEAEFDFIGWEYALAIPFKPIVEGDVPGALLPHHPKKLMADGPANDVPYMTGITIDEGSCFINAIFRNDSALHDFDVNFQEYGSKALMTVQSPEKTSDIFESLRRAYFTPGPFDKSKYLEAANLFTDVYFLWPAIKSEQLHRLSAKGPAYFYEFGYEGSEACLKAVGETEAFGVSHGYDLPYLFNFWDNFQPGPADVLMSMIMTDFYSSFARDGVPSSNLTNTKWVPVTTSGTDVEYLNIRSPRDITMKKDLLPERWNLIKRLFEPDEHQHTEL